MVALLILSPAHGSAAMLGLPSSWPAPDDVYGTNPAPPSATLNSRRDTYLKIKVKIKHLQKLKLNIFPVKIKHSLDKKFSKFDKKIKKSFYKILRKFGFRSVQRILKIVDLKKC